MNESQKWMLGMLERLVIEDKELTAQYQKVTARLRDIGKRISAAKSLIRGEISDNPSDLELVTEFARVEQIESEEDAPESQPTLQLLPTPEAATEPTSTETPTESNGSKPEVSVEVSEKGSKTQTVIDAMKNSGNAGYTPIEIWKLLQDQGINVAKQYVYNVVGKQEKRGIMRKEGEKYYVTPLGMQYKPNQKKLEVDDTGYKSVTNELNEGVSIN